MVLLDLKKFDKSAAIKAGSDLTYIGVLSSAWCPGGRTTAKPFCQGKQKHSHTHGTLHTVTLLWSIEIHCV